MDLDLMVGSEITNRPPSLLPSPPVPKASLHLPVSLEVSHGPVAGFWPTDCAWKRSMPPPRRAQRTTCSALLSPRPPSAGHPVSRVKMAERRCPGAPNDCVQHSFPDPETEDSEYKK